MKAAGQIRGEDMGKKQQRLFFFFTANYSFRVGKSNQSL
jgi:hypothetical protein